MGWKLSFRFSSGGAVPTAALSTIFLHGFRGKGRALHHLLPVSSSDVLRQRVVVGPMPTAMLTVFLAAWSTFIDVRGSRFHWRTHVTTTTRSKMWHLCSANQIRQK